MKKILTVSLFAVMAVSAAHAKIASVEYVDPKFQAINTTIGTWGTDQQAVGTDVAAAVVKLSGDIAAMGGDTGSVAGQINAAINELVTEGQVKTNTDAIATLNGDENKAGSVANAIKQSKDYADGLAGNYDAAGSADGALAEAKLYTDAAAKADANGDLGSGFVKEYVDEKIGVLQGNTGLGGIQTELGQQQEEIDGLGQALEAEAARAIAAEEKIATYDEEGKLSGGSVKVNADAIAAMDLAAVGAEGSFIEFVSEEDGKVSATAKGFATEVAAGGNIAPTAGAVKTYTDTAISNLTDSETMPAECKAQGARCALIAVGGELQWEPVEY